MPYRDPEKIKSYQRLWKRKERFRHKEKAVELLGGKCLKCGYSDHLAALQIDHINPKKRKTPGDPNQATKLIRGHIKLEDVQLLCANCHAIKTYDEDRFLFNQYIQ